MSDNTRANLFCLKQFGLSERLLEELYMRSLSPLEGVFSSQSHSYQNAQKKFSKKDYILSERKADYIKITEEVKNYFSKNPSQKIYFKYDKTLLSEMLPRNEHPLFLYSKGDEKLFSNEEYRVAVVGTRTPNKNSIEKAIFYTKLLVKGGIVVVSGLAEGIDTIAHETALEFNGKTIAVLPTNFINIYPKKNINLANKIHEKGALLTAIGPCENSFKTSFLDRNRLVANICSEVFVVETNMKSGTMNTVRHAKELGKRVSFIEQSDKEVNDTLLKMGAIMIESN